MAVRARAFAAVAVAVALAHPASATHVGVLDCGGLSPFGNYCQDPDYLPMSNHPVPSWSMLGFVGRVEIVLEQDLPWGLKARMVWACHRVALNNPVVPDYCEDLRFEPSFLRSLINGIDVHMYCTASPTPWNGVPLGPWGSWGCKVTL